MNSFARIPPIVKRVVAPALFLIVLLYYLTHAGKVYTDHVVTKLRDKKTVFLEQFLEDDIGPPINGAGIEKLCEGKGKDNRLVFSCDTAKGGVAQARQYQLQCLRLGIESGASKIILPHIVKRNDGDFRLRRRATAPSDGVPLDYMFDAGHIHEILAAHCPRVEVHSTIADFHDVPTMLTPLDMEVSDVYKGDDLTANSVIAHPEDFKFAVWKHIDRKSPQEGRHYPLRLRLKFPTPLFPVYNDSAQTARELGSVIRVRPDARRLAGSALFALSQRFGIAIDPRSSLAPSEDSFIGVHLRIEKDSKKEFPDYVVQAAAAFDFITATSVKTVFLATGGSAADVERFTARARDFGVTVVTKESLLEGEELAQLRGMTYDQQALVDYEVMKRAGKVVGRSQSKFSWDLAIARAAAYGDVPVVDAPEPEGSVTWEDRFTTLFGDMRPSRGGVLHSTWP
ncbi:uncharacterized protein DNG_00302 [Cephalotrichum gorgonifer]|uniref:O-fucosyltransferase family protein n=1 Tax=Cephalotrichum gorgonifer TaxID=2041049 RepID=A0AAE8SR24_9PEZI|nr:uncharacterized protein DNG_00302 [Cephalotrichum gorgonifer]